MVQPNDAPSEPANSPEDPKQDEGQSETDAVATGVVASAKEALPVKETPPAPQKSPPAPKKSPPPKQTNPKPKAAGYAHLFKFVLVGDSGVGKTSLVRRYVRNEFSPTRDYTIGVDFDIKTTPLSNGDEVKLQLWDTAGQERYRTITTSYYRGANGIIIVYDVNRKESFDNVSFWLREVTNYCNDDIAIVIAGNMADMRTETSEFFGKDSVMELDSVKTSDPEVLAVYECSSKTGEGVEQVFQVAVDELVTRRLDERNPLRKGKTMISEKSIKLGGKDQKAKKKGCC